MSRYNKIICPALLVLIFLPRSPASGAEVAVFLSGDLDAYHTALTGVGEVIQDVSLPQYNMKGDLEEGKKIVYEIIQKKPTAVLAIGARAAKLASEAIINIPVVYCLVFNPFELGLKGNNLSGVAMTASPEDQYEIFLDVLPSLKRLGILYDPGKSLDLVEQGRKAASKSGIALVERQIFSAKDVASALKGIILNIDALWLLPDTTVVNKEVFAYFLKVTLENRRPIFAFSDGLVKSGALLSLSPGYRESGKKAGEQINQIIRGADPQREPFAYPQGLIYINSKTSEALGIKIPEQLLRRAHKIF